MTNADVSPQDAFNDASTSPGYPTKTDIRFKCPHCLAFAQHQLGLANSVVSMFGSTSVAGITLSTPLSVAQCTSCNGLTLFVKGLLAWPKDLSDAPRPLDEMPEALKADFEEARTIYRLSPRGAAALLRLCVQKLFGELGMGNMSIDAAIKKLVAEGRLDTVLQHAADALRVIGNESVHPGTMDLKDNTQTAYALFEMLNYIVERTVTFPSRAKALFDSLPDAKKAAIAARDGVAVKPA